MTTPDRNPQLQLIPINSKGSLQIQKSKAYLRDQKKILGVVIDYCSRILYVPVPKLVAALYRGGFRFHHKLLPIVSYRHADA